MHNTLPPPGITYSLNVSLSCSSSPQGPIQALSSTASFQENWRSIRKVLLSWRNWGQQQNQRRKINAKKFYIYRVCCKGETLRSSRGVWTVQGEMNQFSIWLEGGGSLVSGRQGFGAQTPGCLREEAMNSWLKLSFYVRWPSCFTREPDRRKKCVK